MKYNCNLCDYFTDDSSHYKRHLKSKKHERNSLTVVPNNLRQKSANNKVIDDPNDKVRNAEKRRKTPKTHEISYFCNYCNSNFTRSHGLSKHQKTCSKREDIIKEFEQKEKLFNDTIKQKNNQLKKMEKYYGDIINNIGSMGPKNINSITYILGNYDKAPHLEAIKTNNLSKLPLKTNRDIENIICSHKNNLLVDQIIEAIVFIYKKKDPSEQSIWVTDTSRHNYIIKELLHDDDSKWVIDKKGVKSEKYLVKPILEHIRKIVFEYLQTSPKLLDNPKITSTDRNIILDCQHNGNELIKEIDDNTIGPEIIKKLSKHIHHNKNDAPMIEEVE